MVLFLLLLPFLELWLLLEVGPRLGAPVTIALVVLGFFAGTSLIRHGGHGAVLRARERLARGEVPGPEIANGLLVAIAGILFLFPGFLTDVFGLLLLIPPVRRLVARRLLVKLAQRGRQQGASIVFGRMPGQGPWSQPMPGQQGPWMGPMPGKPTWTTSMPGERIVSTEARVLSPEEVEERRRQREREQVPPKGLPGSSAEESPQKEPSA